MFVPIYYKKIVDDMTNPSDHGQIRFCWDLILAYVGFKVIQGKTQPFGCSNHELPETVEKAKTVKKAKNAKTNERTPF